MIVETLNHKKATIEDWLHNQWEKISPPFYASVDLRDSSFKLGPVDLNLYPAGFNNLTLADQNEATVAVKQLLNQIDDHYQRILLVIENHTRNPYYLENVATLKRILSKAGFTIKLSMLSTLPQNLITPSGASLSIDTVTKYNHLLHINDFIPDCIILNNDLSQGIPELLNALNQPIFPPPSLGWHQRKKSQYFQHYDDVCQEFSKVIGIDNWLINPLFTRCDQVDFKSSTDNTVLLERSEMLLEKIQKKYQEYHIKQKPYLVIKADSGSYGMGIMVSDNINDIAHLSRKQRQHMAQTKGNRPIQSVILQEGIATVTRYQQSIAEPVTYFIGSQLVGGFYRTHPKRTTKDNLNVPGMQLIPISFHQKSAILDKSRYAYEVIAQLAVLAAAFEIQSVSAL